MSDSAPRDPAPRPGPSLSGPTILSRLSRRSLLVGAGLTLGAGAAAGVGGYWWHAHEGGLRSAVVVAKADAYDERLEEIIRQGLTELGFTRDFVRDKRVLLKPNLVEPTLEAPHINTHPLLVRSVAQVFRRWDARSVLVAEGQGHIRDTTLVLEQSGLGPVLDEARLDFVDLNHDDIYSVKNTFRATNLASLYLPRTLQQADLIVSLPKMKTHHWAGVTLSMKNLFGTMPGIFYGWPKNVLHHAGIPQSIVDITATVRPHLAIVDGIVGMEGDGPIMGTPKQANLLVMGTNLPAVDATTARLMGFDPWRIDYLKLASGRLGPIRAEHIEQRGEGLASVATRFELHPHPHFRQFR